MADKGVEKDPEIILLDDDDDDDDPPVLTISVLPVQQTVKKEPAAVDEPSKPAETSTKAAEENEEMKTLEEDITPDKDSPEKNAPEKNSPEKDSPENNSPGKDAAEKETPGQDSPDKDIPEKNAPEKNTQEKDAAEKETPEPDISERDTPDINTPAKNAPEKETPAKNTPDKDTPEKNTPEKDAAEKDTDEAPAEIEDVAMKETATSAEPEQAKLDDIMEVDDDSDLEFIAELPAKKDASLASVQKDATAEIKTDAPQLHSLTISLSSDVQMDAEDMKIEVASLILSAEKSPDNVIPSTNGAKKEEFQIPEKMEVDNVDTVKNENNAITETPALLSPLKIEEIKNETVKVHKPFSF